MKKVWKYLSSMQFAVILLLFLIAACAAGSFVTQGREAAWYTAAYGQRRGGLILSLHLDDVFHSLWFIALSAVLCLNLLLCSIVRLPSLLRLTKAWGSGGQALREAERAAERTKTAESGDAGEPELREADTSGRGALTAGGIGDPEAFFRKIGFRISGKTENIVTAARGRAGLWGAWICHLGILILILGFGFGQAVKKEYAVYGVPGSTREIGDTGILLTIDDFRIGLREDDTVEQYTADLTARDPAGGKESSVSVSVNNPATMFGMKFYQNSTGWAADISVLKDGNEIQKETVCAGEYLAVAGQPDLVIYLNAFYPDYVLKNGKPGTESSALVNPAYLYSVYFRNEILGMNALMEGEELTIDDYTVTFTNPRSYTLIQIKRDPFTPLALLGGLVTLAGLVLAFYVMPGQAAAVKTPDGRWAAAVTERRKDPSLPERFMKAKEQEK